MKQHTEPQTTLTLEAARYMKQCPNCLGAGFLKATTLRRSEKPMTQTTEKQVVLGLDNAITDKIVDHLASDTLPLGSRVYDVTYDPETKLYRGKVAHE